MCDAASTRRLSRRLNFSTDIAPIPITPLDSTCGPRRLVLFAISLRSAYYSIAPSRLKRSKSNYRENFWGFPLSVSASRSISDPGDGNARASVVGENKLCTRWSNQYQRQLNYNPAVKLGIRQGNPFSLFPKIWPVSTFTKLISVAFPFFW